jgi:putative membrane protein
MRASNWTFEPGVLLALSSLAVVYGVAAKRLARATRGNAVTPAEIAAFAAGWIAIVVALVSPLDRMSEALFSAHMAQHELLMIVAAPLIVAGTSQSLLDSLHSMIVRRTRAASRVVVLGVSLCRFAISAVAAWTLHAVAVVAWHVPALFDLAVDNDAVHSAQHLCFFGTAVVFWWGILRRPSGRGAAMIAVFTTALYTSALGALLTVAPRAWYSVYASSTATWGLTPIEDQQLGGLVMWVPVGIVYTAVGLWLFAAWLRESERAAASLPRASRGIAIVLAALAVSFAACRNRDAYNAAAAMTGGDPERGADALSTYGCVTCHTIPGLREGRGLVGPPLTSIASRVYLAGRLPNTPENLERWIQHPRAVDEKTAMPDTGVTDADARDIAAYLYTLR